MIDLVSSIPLDMIMHLFRMKPESADQFDMATILKAVRVLRLERIISALSTSDDIKTTMRIFKLCF